MIVDKRETEWSLRRARFKPNDSRASKWGREVTVLTERPRVSQEREYVRFDGKWYHLNNSIEVVVPSFIHTLNNAYERLVSRMVLEDSPEAVEISR